MFNHSASVLFRTASKVKNHFVLYPNIQSDRVLFKGDRYCYYDKDRIKEGLKSRGDNQLISMHRYDAVSSFYVPSTTDVLVAAKFASIRGQVIVHQYPLYYVDVVKVNPYLSDLDEELNKSILAESEFAGIDYIPFSDVILTRKVLALPIAAPGFYYGDAFLNPDFKLRNFSFEILSAAESEVEIISKGMSLKEGKKGLTYEDAKVYAEALKKEASVYQLDHTSPYFNVGPVIEDKRLDKVIEIGCDDFHVRMKASNAVIKTHVSFAQAKGLFAIENEKNKKTENSEEIADNTPKNK